MKTIISKTVSKKYDNMRLSDFLKFEMKLSSSLIKKAKRIENGITANGNPCFTNYLIKVGDEIEVIIQTEAEKSENIPIFKQIPDIIYEDDHILIVNKPQNLPTHPSLNNYDKTLAGMVINYYLQKGENFVFRPVNRLDKGTSGICVVAKNPYIHELLKQQFHSNNFKREYLAVVCGRLYGCGVIKAPIYRESNSIIKRCVNEKGDYAETEYFSERVLNNKTIVRLKLKTGRTHQIRVHLSHIGYPLVGDFLYGEETKLIDRPALHSYKIELVHPITKEKLSFTCPISKDIINLIDIN